MRQKERKHSITLTQADCLKGKSLLENGNVIDEVLMDVTMDPLWLFFPGNEARVRELQVACVRGSPAATTVASYSLSERCHDRVKRATEFVLNKLKDGVVSNQPEDKGFCSHKYAIFLR